MWLRLKRKYNRLKYRQLAFGISVHYFKQEDLAVQGYYSQCGQDKWIVETLLPGRTGGVFVDVGAHDGVTFSNTYFLEKNLGWQGLLVEPIPDVFRKLIENRRSTAVHGCVGPQSGRAKFRIVTGYAEMLSGLVDRYDPRHLERIRKETAEHGGSCREIEVDCFRLDELLAKHGIAEIDYLSIDVENAEFSILETIDFGRFRIRVIGVENAYDDYRIPLLLKKKGYRFHSKIGDEFFVRDDLLAIGSPGGSGRAVLAAVQV